jgi:hypothetical protein
MCNTECQAEISEGQLTTFSSGRAGGHCRGGDSLKQKEERFHRQTSSVTEAKYAVLKVENVKLTIRFISSEVYIGHCQIESRSLPFRLAA